MKPAVIVYRSSPGALKAFTAVFTHPFIGKGCKQLLAASEEHAREQLRLFPGSKLESLTESDFNDFPVTET